MADLINEGGILLAGLPGLCERGYSLTPVDISQSDHNPTEEQRTEHMNRNRSFLLLGGTGMQPSLYSAEKCQRFTYGRALLPDKHKGHLGGK